ncbi:MAG TPA: ABC transporter substrate-binding protein [Longimicrobiales bacterium]|nr:ABC transporter substrate-binding protein [Longimicrobiales bacterium]
MAGPTDLGTLNSLVSGDAWSTEFINNVLFMPLLRLNPDLTYAPYLAESWRMIGDTVVVFRIRRDVFWHDGKKTTAHDVVFTFERIKDEETGFTNSEFFDNWESAQAADSFTVRFRIKPHVEPLIGWALTAVMPKHLLDSIPSARMRQAAFNRAPVGNGPFRFVSGRTNDRWIFEANKNFPRALGGRPRLDRVVWRPIPDNNAQLTELRTGGIDIGTAIRAEQAKALALEGGYRLLLRQSNRYHMISWSAKHAPLNDARVRRALSMGINRQQIITVLRGGFAQIAVSPIPPSHWAYDKKVTPLTYDPAGARRLLAQAGYPNGFEIELLIAANNAFNRDLGEMVRSDLAKIGVTVKTRPLDFAAMIQTIGAKERNYDGAFLTFNTDLRLGFTDTFHSKNIDGPYQFASYANPQLDKLLDRANVVTNRAEATRIWSQVQKILRDDQPWTFLWWAPEILVARDRVQGVTVDVRGALRSLPLWWVRN